MEEEAEEEGKQKYRRVFPAAGSGFEPTKNALFAAVRRHLRHILICNLRYAGSSLHELSRTARM